MPRGKAMSSDVSSAGGGEVGLHSLAELARRGKEDNVVFLDCGGDVVVEVVHHQAGPVGGNSNFQLSEEAHDGGGDGVVGGEGEEHVSICIDEVEQDLGGEVGTQTFGEKKMIS